MQLLENRRIFMLEDDAYNMAIGETLLRKQGALVLTDRWGRDSLSRLKLIAPVDIILLDLMLPNNVSGYDVFKQIRAVSDYDDVPIVAVSASDASEAIPKAKELGFSGFINKPLDFMLFAEQIARLIDGEEVWHVS